MIHVVLDTNVYRQNPRFDNVYFKALERLACENRLKLYIPYIVEREFQTQQKEAYGNAINKAVAAFDSLDKLLTTDVLIEAKELKKAIDLKKEDILTNSESNIINWATAINADRIPLCLDQSINSLEAYFQGKPPLKVPKIRKDIPDSFILHSVEKILVDNHPINFISNDKQLLEAFDDYDNVITFQQLSDFIESDVIQKEIADLDLLKNQQDIIKALEVYEKETHNIKSTVANEIGDLLVGNTINNYSIPDDNNEATITGYNEPHNIETLINEAFYYGNSQFGIPFTLTIEVSTIFYLYKADYYSLEESETLSISDHNKHYFEAEKEYEIQVLGLVTLSIDQENLDIEELAENISDIEISTIDEINLLNADE